MQRNSKFADDTKPKGALNMLEDKAAIQRELSGQEEPCEVQ